MLKHYTEIAKEDGNDFIVNQIPEYLFTWSPGDYWITVWVYNNIAEYKESFFKFVRTLDLTQAKQMLELENHNDIDAEIISQLVAIFAVEVFTQKMTGTLPVEYLFTNN